MKLLATGNTAEVFEYGDDKDLYAEYFESAQDEAAGNRLMKDLSQVQKLLSSFESAEIISYKDFLGVFDYGAQSKSRSCSGCIFTDVGHEF